MCIADEHSAKPNSVAVVGVGNIGLQAANQLAGISEVERLILIDSGSVEAGNRSSQDYRTQDIGHPKAVAAAKRLRRNRQRKNLQIESIVARIENVPWGRLRVGVIAGCVDSLGARSSIQHIAWRLGIPYVDSGIRAEGLLARVQVHIPGADAPCIECPWGDKHHELAGQSYSCDGRVLEPAPTGSTSALGGLAASMLVLECQKLLKGSFDQLLSAKQVIYEAQFHHHYLNVLRRHPACASDHEIWSIQNAPSSVRTVGDLLQHGRKLFGGELPAAISADRKSWVKRLVCRQCGHQARALRLQGRIGRRLGRCAPCGGEMQPIGFYLRPRLETRHISDRLLARPLRNLGLRAGDVLTLTTGQQVRHIQLNMAKEPGGN